MHMQPKQRSKIGIQPASSDIKLRQPSRFKRGLLIGGLALGLGVGAALAQEKAPAPAPTPAEKPPVELAAGNERVPEKTRSSFNISKSQHGMRNLAKYNQYLKQLSDALNSGSLRLTAAGLDSLTKAHELDYEVGEISKGRKPEDLLIFDADPNVPFLVYMSERAQLAQAIVSAKQNLPSTQVSPASTQTER